jgi:hypothetical protein
VVEKPTIDRFLFDLVEALKTLPYGKEHIDVHEEQQITVNCSDGNLIIRFDAQPPGII